MCCPRERESYRPTGVCLLVSCAVGLCCSEHLIPPHRNACSSLRLCSTARTAPQHQHHHHQQQEWERQIPGEGQSTSTRQTEGTTAGARGRGRATPSASGRRRLWRTQRRSASTTWTSTVRLDIFPPGPFSAVWGAAERKAAPFQGGVIGRRSSVKQVISCVPR